MPIDEKAKKIIHDSEAFMDEETEVLNEDLLPLEKDIINAILKRVNEMTGGESVTDTKKTQSKISALRNDLKKIIKGSDWKKSGNRFLSAFDPLIDYSVDLNKQINGVAVKKSKLTGVRNVALEKYESLLFGESFEQAIIEPHIRKVQELVSTGANFATIKEEIETFASGNQGVVRYGTQISRDSLSQFTGAINTRIGNELGLEWLSYSGSIISNTRKQCRRWVTYRFIHESELGKEINWAFKNGSGMIDPTTEATFTINRGGYNCRHYAVWVSEDVVDDFSFERVGIVRK